MSEKALISPQNTPAAAGNVQSLSAQNDLHKNEANQKKPDNNILLIQTKLTVGSPYDPYEKEADEVADKVMRMPEQSFVQRSTGGLRGQDNIQREPEKDEEINLKKISTTTFLQKKCAKCAQEEKEEIQLKPISQTISPCIQTKGNASSTSPISDSLSSSIQNSRGIGSPLDNSTQTFMESRFGTDFSSVKIHTGSESAQMSNSLNAQAFTVGNDVYFNQGKYQPNAEDGKRLLAHELTHVAQQSDFSENQTNRINTFFLKHSSNQGIIQLTRDPQIDHAIEQIHLIPVPMTPQSKAAEILNILSGIDLNDQDNLNPVLSTINEFFDPRERGEIMVRFLTFVDVNAPSRSLPPSYTPSAEDEARMQRTIEQMQIGPRGAYRQYGVGVLAPVLSQPGRHLLPLVQATEHAFAGGGAFLSGIFTGLQQSMTEEDRSRLMTRLLESSVLNHVFPFVFAAGAVVGIGEDVVNTVKDIYRILTDFGQFLSDMRSLFDALTSPDSRAIAHAMGVQIGVDYGTRIVTLTRGNIFEFSFGLGRMIGPTIVYTILGILGVPELLASSLIGRLMTLLEPFLERFPRLMRTLERVSSRLVRRRSHAGVDELEADLERSFQHTFTEPHEPHPHGTGASTTQAPEVRAGFAPQHLAGFRRFMGRALSDTQVADLARVWNSVANPGEIASLSLQNSRRLFNNQRGRFWRAVRSDANASRIFTDAGCVFEGGATTAPFYRLPDGSAIRMTVDHMIERQTNPTRALDPTNLRIVTTRENTVMLRQLHAQDPFIL